MFDALKNKQRKLIQAQALESLKIVIRNYDELQTEDFFPVLIALCKTLDRKRKREEKGNMKKVEAYVETQGDKTVMVVPSDKYRMIYIVKLKDLSLTIECKESFDDAMHHARQFLNGEIN